MYNTIINILKIYSIGVATFKKYLLSYSLNSQDILMKIVLSFKGFNERQRVEQKTRFVQTGFNIAVRTVL